MTQELSNVELQNINGGELTPENAGRAVGRWAAQAIAAAGTVMGFVAFFS